MNSFTQPATPDLAAAKSRYAAALQKMSALAMASVSNPALEGDYQRAVSDVAKAEAELKGISHG
jgi:hypothetical protein